VPRGREPGLVPASYQAGRWAVLTGLSLLTVAAAGVALASMLSLFG
jgi:hypothetical protein